MGKRPRIDKERIHKLKIRPVLTHAYGAYQAGTIKRGPKSKPLRLLFRK